MRILGLAFSPAIGRLPILLLLISTASLQAATIAS
jgi:hypothetical protein